MFVKFKNVIINSQHLSTGKKEFDLLISYLECLMSS